MYLQIYATYTKVHIWPTWVLLSGLGLGCLTPLSTMFQVLLSGLGCLTPLSTMFQVLPSDQHIKHKYDKKNDLSS